MDEASNRAKVKAGFKGSGRFFENVAQQPPFRFVDGIPSEVKQARGVGSFPQPQPVDTFNSRNSKK